MALKVHVLNITIENSLKVYEKIFHEKPNSQIDIFLKDLFHVGMGTIIAAVISLVFNIMGGRILGPSQYGKFALLQSVALFLSMPMLMGISTAMLKYTTEKKDVPRQQKIITTSYLLTLTFTMLSVIIYLSFSSFILDLFKIDSSILYYSIVFAILYTYYNLTTSTLRSLDRIKEFSYLKPVYSIILIITLSVLIYYDFKSFKSMTYSIYLANLILGTIAFRITQKYISIKKINIDWAKSLVKYSNFAFLGGVSYIIYTNVDKILLNKYMSVIEVGIYNSYYFSSINLTAVLISIFQTVYFPMLCRSQKKRDALKKLNKCMGFVPIIGLPLIFILQFIILKIYGQDYKIDFLLMLIFATTSVLFICYDTYSWFLSSLGVKGAKLSLYGTFSIAISNIVLNILLIPIFGLRGAIGSTALAYFIGLYLVYEFSKRIKLPS